MERSKVVNRDRIWSICDHSAPVLGQISTQHRIDIDLAAMVAPHLDGMLEISGANRLYGWCNSPTPGLATLLYSF